MQFDRELDTRGLMCPLPIIKTRAAMETLQPGEVLKVVSTDVGSTRDMPAFAQVTRNPLLSSQVEGTDYIYYLQKKGAA
jgi:tRNA 2-thiouridine synthesizing protein A